MSSEGSEKLSDFKLIGGSIKLAERPESSSHSSISKRFQFSKFSSRPSSALPRLCPAENSQDDSVSFKKDHRPFSADFVMPNPLSGKSKETLTDGSFESIYVPVDFQLPSSNLFKELLEEDLDQWRNLDISGKTLSEQSIPTLVMSDSERSHKNDKSKSRRDEKMSEETTSAISQKKQQDCARGCVTPNTSPRKEELKKDQYVMTPGLTSKPPLPKKTFVPPSVIEDEEMKDDPIYDYFAIKYNLEAETSRRTLVEKMKRDKNSEEIDVQLEVKTSNADGSVEKHANGDEAEEERKNHVDIDEKNKKDKDLQVNDWLDEIDMDQVRFKTNVSSQNEPPLLSEIDIDDLFKMDEIGESSEKNSEKIPENNTEKTNTLKKSKGSKSTVSKKQTSTKTQNERKGSSEKKERESKTTRTKFKPNKVCSPQHETLSMQDNVETWMEKDVEIVKKNRLEFSELIDSVEELESTTELSSKSDTPVLENLKQENCDDIETIIEALEEQDKTSQKNIQTIKRIVTSELSNSLILNENEDNLLFKKKGEMEKNKIERKGSGRGNRQRLDSDECISRESLSGKEESEKKRIHSEEPSKCEDDKVQDDQRGRNVDFLRDKSQYKDLLSYLDEVDKKCQDTLEIARERPNTTTKFAPETSGLFDTIPNVEDLISLTPEELSTFVIHLSLRVKDKTSCISLLQNELSSLREKLLNQTKQAEISLRQKLKEQKEETERIARRHQKFIDQLMDEKKNMAKKCEDLVEEMHNIEDKYVANMKAIEHRHQVEMQKMKDMQAASEKLRRERWIEGRTQKIKEMAVKSIEPEVERMEKRHQEELSNLRMVHKREIEELELRAARKLQEHSENLREQLIDDREKALAHERDVMRLRYEKLVESEERNYQEQRRRLQADHSSRLAECQEREAQSVVEKERAIKQAQEEFEEKLQSALRRHSNEIKIAKETAAIEMENWKNTVRKQQSALLMEKEAAIRRECKKERDREIELVIEKLENESAKARSQIEQTAENRIKRLRDKYEMEIKDLEMLEKDAQTKYCESRSKMLEYEETILTLKNNVKHLENQLMEEKVKLGKLESEREGVREEIRKQYEDKVRSLEREAEDLRSSADKQVEQLYSRVRVTLARKEELLAELTTDYKALKEKCLYLENMMEQQRKEYMINS